MATNINTFTRDMTRLQIAGIKRIFTAADGPVEMFARDCPALVPNVGQWLESSTSTRQTSRNVNIGGMWKRERVWRYTCFHSEIGADRKPGANMGTLADLVDNVENALCHWIPAGAMELISVTIGRVGPVKDASGKDFLGFPVTLTTRETY